MPTQYDLNLRDYWRVIRKRMFIIVFTTIALGVFSVSFSILWQPIPLYQAIASVKVEQRGSITGLYIQTLSWSQTDYMETQSTIIKSYYIMEAVAKKMGLIPSDLPSEEVRGNTEYQNVLLHLRNSIETEQEGISDIINIKVTSEDTTFARRLANTTAQIYQEQHALNLNKITFETRKFIENQLKVVKDKLRKAEDAVRKFREDNKLISLSSQTSTILRQITSLQAGYEKAQVSLKSVSIIEKQLERTGNSPLTSKTSYYINEASSLYKSLNDRLVTLMLQRDSLLLVYTEQYPQIIEINKQITEIVVNMKAQLSSQKKALTKNIETMKKKIDEMDRQIKVLPEKGLELARLEQEVGVNREVYMLLEKKYQESLIKEAEKIEEVQIVKPALEPNTPINPPMTMATGAVGIIIGLILGILFAFVVETFDTSIGDIEEIEELTGVNVLGIIPHVTIQEIKTMLLDKIPGKMDDKTLERYARIVSHFAPKSTLAENYRTLRTNLSFAGLEGDLKTIVFTSSSPQEGKTTIATNLAVTMAQAGHRTLLVDGDMRRPMVAELFGIDQAPGLSDVILGSYSLEDTIQGITNIVMGKISIDAIMMTPGLDNLYILTSGTIPPNPAEMAASNRIAELIKQLSSEYDIVLIDAPPLLSATDAAIYASIADGVILVYRAGKIGRTILKRAKAQLDNVKAKVVGIVLNGLKADISPDFARQDYYEYYYGEEDQKTESRSFLSRLFSIPANMLASSEKSTGVKSSPVKSVILLFTLILLLIAILHQYGYIRLPWFDVGSSFIMSVISPTDNRDRKPTFRKRIDSRVKDTLEQNVKVISSEKGKTSFSNKKPVPPVERDHSIENTVKKEHTTSLKKKAGIAGSSKTKRQ